MRTRCESEFLGDRAVASSTARRLPRVVGRVGGSRSTNKMSGPCPPAEAWAMRLASISCMRLMGVGGRSGEYLRRSLPEMPHAPARVIL